MTSSRSVPDDEHFDERHVLVYLGLLMGQARDLIFASKHPLRPSQFRVIAMVPYDAGISMTDLAERVGMTKQGVGQFVSRLVESGQLAIEEDPRDRRRRVVTRTRRGNEVTAELAWMLERLEEKWAKQVGERRYAQFRRTLEDIALS